MHCLNMQDISLLNLDRTLKEGDFTVVHLSCDDNVHLELTGSTGNDTTLPFKRISEDGTFPKLADICKVISRYTRGKSKKVIDCVVINSSNSTEAATLLSSVDADLTVIYWKTRLDADAAKYFSESFFEYLNLNNCGDSKYHNAFNEALYLLQLGNRFECQDPDTNQQTRNYKIKMAGIPGIMKNGVDSADKIGSSSKTCSSNKSSSSVKPVAFGGTSTGSNVSVALIPKESPRSIMSRMFKLNGHPMDPCNIDVATDYIEKWYRRNNGCGSRLCSRWWYEYDLFISYRQDPDKNTAENLYRALLVKGFKVFLDQSGIDCGDEWKSRFIYALNHSNKYIALISDGGLKRVREYKAGSEDNVLLEYKTALNIRETKDPNFICPLLLGEYVEIGKDKCLKRFDGFNLDQYPDVVFSCTA